MEPAPATSKRNTMIGGVVGVIVFVLSYFGIQQLIKPPSFDKAMMEAASQLNASCPIMVDQDTRLDNAVAMPGMVLQYNYTLVNLNASEINADTLKAFLEPNIINNVKTHPDLKAYRENKVTMAYNYKDKNGVFLFKVEVPPDIYAAD